MFLRKEINPTCFSICSNHYNDWCIVMLSKFCPFEINVKVLKRTFWMRKRIFKEARAQQSGKYAPRVIRVAVEPQTKLQQQQQQQHTPTHTHELKDLCLFYTFHSSMLSQCSSLSLLLHSSSFSLSSQSSTTAV